MAPPDVARAGRRAQWRRRVAAAAQTGAGRWRVPAWAVVPAALAPFLLLVGPIVAGGLQPAGFDPLRESISGLAAENANDRGLMTAALVVVGVALICTAVGLFGAGLLARLLLGASGASTAMVAAFPLPQDRHASWAHALFAVLGFTGLAAWPMGLMAKWGGPAETLRPFPARQPAAGIATAVMFGILGWFGLEELFNGPHLGLSERVAAVTEATWPLVVVVAARVAQQKAATAAVRAR
jgi:hypothetical protein